MMREGQRYTRNDARSMEGHGLSLSFILLPIAFQAAFMMWVMLYGNTENYKVLLFSTLANVMVVWAYAICADGDRLMAFALCIIIEIASVLYSINGNVLVTSQNIIIWMSLGAGICFAIIFPTMIKTACQYAEVSLVIIWIVTIGLTLLIKTSGTLFLHVAGTRIEMAECYKILAATYFAILYRAFRPDRSRLTFEISYSGVLLLSLIWLNEYGTLAVVLFIFIVMQIAFGQKASHTMITIGLYLGIGASIIAAAVLLKDNTEPYAVFISKLLHLEKITIRLAGFLPNQSLGGDSYQLTKSYEGVAWGGLFGNRSIVDIPVSESDFAFGWLCECLGVITGIAYIVCVDILFLRIIKHTKEMAGEHGSSIDYFSFGLGLGLCFQSIISCGTTVGLFPIMGNPSVFISTGGTFRCLSCSVFFLALKRSQTRIKPVEEHLRKRRGEKCFGKMRRSIYLRQPE